MTDIQADMLIEGISQIVGQLKEVAGELRAIREELQEMRLIQHRDAPEPPVPAARPHKIKGL